MGVRPSALPPFEIGVCIMAEIAEVPGKFSGYIRKASTSAFGRIARYSIVRLLTMFVTVVIGIYLTIMIANMGGYVDTIMRLSLIHISEPTRQAEISYVV